MLSRHERRMLVQIESSISVKDPRFVAALRAGHPRSPREYRRTSSVLCLLLAVCSIAALLATGQPVALLMLFVATGIGLLRFMTRELDRP